MDWKYVLSSELEDPGFDFSVLSEFRDRLVVGGGEQLLLDRLLERFGAEGLLKGRGKQRADSTFVLANIRVMNRAELVGETLRATLNELAEVDPGWLRSSWVESEPHCSPARAKRPDKCCARRYNCKKWLQLRPVCSPPAHWSVRL